jgi:hypothetical protein
MVNMDISCPSCKAQLKELGSSGKFFRCLKENIFWEICEGIGGPHLRTYYTPSGYKGPMMAAVRTIPGDESDADDM